MPSPTPNSAPRQSMLLKLRTPANIADLGPVAGRFIYALRLVSVHERARRDPVPELAARLGSIDIAARSLALSQAITSVWPENIRVSRFCCQFLTHDEATIGALVDCACSRDSKGFASQIEGLIRPERVHRLWDAVLGLIMAEMRAA